MEDNIFGVGICRNCGQSKQWLEDIRRFEENPDDPEFEGFEPPNPCEYCGMNNNPYAY